jgi:LmbE family N-acetylglucosaminyl deacetylase
VCLEKWVRRSGYGMMQLELGRARSAELSVLCLGAHSDDIEIGCGGTLLQLKQSGLRLKICWVVFSASGVRGDEARASAERLIEGCKSEVILKEFRDGFLPYNGMQVKESFEDLKLRIDPDIIFTHWSGDAHQDHRLISEMTWNTFRNHLILEYEIPKYDGDMGRPSVFVPLERSTSQKKVDHLLAAFESQRNKHWFTGETFWGLMRLRGMEANAPSGYAEAFFARKMILAPSERPSD